MERRKGRPSDVLGSSSSSQTMAPRKTTSTAMSLTYCVLFITFEVAKQAVTYATRHYNNGVYPISSSAIVCCIELVKLVMCLVPAVCTTGLSSFQPSLVFAVPSLIYCANNNLYLFALNYTTPPTWNVLIQSRVVMTALTYRIVFGRQISAVRWVALLLLMLGIALAQLAGSSSSPASQDIYVLPQALVLSVISAAMSTAASIITEYLFKSDKRPFLEQQVQMYAFGFVIASGWSVIATKGDVFKISSESLRPEIVLLLIAAILLGGAGGLAVAVIIKALDNIVKIYASSISILLTAVLCSFLFPEKFILNTAFVFAVMLILISSILYDRQDISNLLPSNLRVPRFLLTRKFLVLFAVAMLLVPIAFLTVMNPSSTAKENQNIGLRSIKEGSIPARSNAKVNGGPVRTDNMHPGIPGVDLNGKMDIQDTIGDGKVPRQVQEMVQRKSDLQQRDRQSLRDKEARKRSRKKDVEEEESDWRKHSGATENGQGVDGNHKETYRLHHPKSIKVKERKQAHEEDHDDDEKERIMHKQPDDRDVMHGRHGHGQGKKVHGEKEERIVHGYDGQKDEEHLNEAVGGKDEEIPDRYQQKDGRESDRQPESIGGKNLGKSGTEAPKVVHFVWDGGRDFRFHDLLSVKSAHKHIEPETIVFHAAKAPKGRWWKEATDIPTLQFQQISPGEDRNDKDQDQEQRGRKTSNFLKTKVDILLREGGIMLDTDTFVLRSFDPLLRYECVLSRGAKGLNLGVLIAKRGAQFLRIWKKSMEEDPYRAPESVVAKYLDLVHVEDNSLYRPRWTDGWDPISIYYSNIDLSSNYAIKLEYDQYNLEETPETTRKLDTTFGNMARSVYFPTPVEVEKSEQSAMAANPHAVVPNEVHFVWFNGSGRGREFEFRHFLSVKAASDYIGADKVFFHTDVGFDGVWWDRVIEREDLKIVPEEPPESLNGVPVKNPAHQELVTALGILKGRGGIYLDIDVIGLKSFEPLRHYDVTMGRHIQGLSTAVICSKPHSEFIKLWTDSFQKFGEQEWDAFAEEEPFRLWTDNPQLVHVEESSLFRPELAQWSDLDALYTNNVPSRENNFAVQLFYDKLGKRINQYDVISLDSTFGAVARKLFYRLDEPLLRGEEPLPHDHYVVPNIFHYVWFSCHDFRFHHLLSVKSMYLRAKADRIIIWTDCTPSGHNWDEAVRDIPVLEVRQRGQPSEVWGNVINNVPHRSDITRMEVLKEYGGIYVDWDVFAMKPFHPLRRFDFILGNEIAGLNNGLILARKDAPFLKVWWENYKHFDDNRWNFHSVMEPFRLAFLHPELIHMEFNTLSRPGWEDWWDMKILWNEDRLFPWQHIYAIHFIYSYHNEEHNPEDIKRMRGTFGQMARWVYYGQIDFVD